MRYWQPPILALAVFLHGSIPALADDAAETVQEVKQILEEQKQTIRELEDRIGELEREEESVQPLPEGTPDPPVTEPGAAPSPAEEAEAELARQYGHRAPVTYRDTHNDQQVPAPRPADYTLDPDFRGFIPIPRTVFLIKFNARPRLDMAANSANAGSEFRFVPALFPADGQPGHGGGWRFNANANGTQLRLDVQAPTVVGNFRFFYQNDFFGSDESHMRYRLQHIYGQFFGVVGGFTYGVFEDPDAWPDTVDYEAPNAVIFARRALVHYQMKLADDWQLTFGLENPDSFVDTTAPNGDQLGEGRNRAPDGGFNVRWTPGELGHMQFSTIFRSIGLDGYDDVDNDDVFGWGINLAGSINLTSNDTAQFWLVYGHGVGGMGNDTSFVDSDAALTSDGNLKALRYWSALGAVTHHWTPRWRSTATFGYVNLENTGMQSGEAYHESRYASVNAIYQVLKRLSVGLEGLYGYKELKNGSDATVFRIQLGLAFSIFD